MTPRGRGCTLDAPIVDLLLSMFSSDELRRFLKFNPRTTILLHELPRGFIFDPATFFAQAVALLCSHGLLDADLRDRLLVERPSHAARIREVFGA